jgi:hypothetical protein
MVMALNEWVELNRDDAKLEKGGSWHRAKNLRVRSRIDRPPVVL